MWQVAQLSQDQKLQVWQAMSKFWQVAVSKSSQSLPCLLHTICIIQSSFIYFPNMPWNPEQLSVCWCCCHRHWRLSQLFFISVAMSTIKICVCLCIYSISAWKVINEVWAVIGLQDCEIRDGVNLWRLVGNRNSRQKARKGRKFFVWCCSLSHRYFCAVAVHAPNRPWAKIETLTTKKWRFWAWIWLNLAWEMCKWVCNGPAGPLRRSRSSGNGLCIQL